MKAGDIVIAPVGSGSRCITEYKEYVVIDGRLPNTNKHFCIINDAGLESFCLVKGCAHIQEMDWIIKNKK